MINSILWGLTYIPTLIFRGWAMSLIWGWYVIDFLPMWPTLSVPLSMGIILLAGVVTPPISESWMVSRIITELRSEKGFIKIRVAHVNRWRGAIVNLVLATITGYILLLAFLLTKV